MQLLYESTWQWRAKLSSNDHLIEIINDTVSVNMYLSDGKQAFQLCKRAEQATHLIDVLLYCVDGGT